MTAQFVADALVMAIWRRGRLEALLHHMPCISLSAIKLSAICRASLSFTSPSFLGSTSIPKATNTPRLVSIGKTIEALRGIERWGASDMMERVFQGFHQIEGPKPQTKWEILGVQAGSDPERCRRPRNELARRYHPDNGSEPNAEMMAKVNQAFTEANFVDVRTRHPPRPSARRTRPFGAFCYNHLRRRIMTDATDEAEWKRREYELKRHQMLIGLYDTEFERQLKLATLSLAGNIAGLFALWTGLKDHKGPVEHIPIWAFSGGALLAVFSLTYSNRSSRSCGRLRSWRPSGCSARSSPS